MKYKETQSIVMIRGGGGEGKERQIREDGEKMKEEGENVQQERGEG